jgi:hypothetical protein
MKSLFLVGAKLLGLYFLIAALIETFAFANFSKMNPYAGQIAVSCLIKFFAGITLAFFTELVAKAVRIPDFPDERPTISVRDALEVGIILVVLLQLPALIVMTFQRVKEYLEFARTQPTTTLLAWDTVALAGCLLAIVFARKLAALLYREPESPPSP